MGGLKSTTCAPRKHRCHKVQRAGKIHVAAQRSRVLKVELNRLEWETKRNEVIHLLALLLITCILLGKSPQLSAMQVLLIFAISLYVNVYPIFVQRYNRLRIVRLLRKCTP